MVAGNLAEKLNPTEHQHESRDPLEHIRWTSVRPFAAECTCLPTAADEADSVESLLYGLKRQLAAGWSDLDNCDSAHALEHMFAALDIFEKLTEYRSDIPDFDRLRLAVLYLAYQFTDRIAYTLRSCNDAACSSCARLKRAQLAVSRVEGGN